MSQNKKINEKDMVKLENNKNKDDKFSSEALLNMFILDRMNDNKKKNN